MMWSLRDQMGSDILAMGRKGPGAGAESASLALLWLVGSEFTALAAAEPALPEWRCKYSESRAGHWIEHLQGLQKFYFKCISNSDLKCK